MIFAKEWKKLGILTNNICNNWYKQVSKTSDPHRSQCCTSFRVEVMNNCLVALDKWIKGAKDLRSRWNIAKLSPIGKPKLPIGLALLPPCRQAWKVLTSQDKGRQIQSSFSPWIYTKFSNSEFSNSAFSNSKICNFKFLILKFKFQTFKCQTFKFQISKFRIWIFKFKFKHSNSKNPKFWIFKFQNFEFPIFKFLIFKFRMFKFQML